MTEEEREINEDIKKGRGRRRFRQISKTNSLTRLFNKSKMHVEKMVRELKFKDPNFASEAAAIRHYVAIGIAAETATTDLRNSLDNTIVKKSIKDATHHEITLLKKDLDLTNELLVELTKRNTEDFADIARRTDMIETKVERVLESTNTTPKTPLTTEVAKQQTAIKDARYAVVLKCVFKSFYVAQILRQVPTDKNDYITWANLINRETHDRVNALPPKELMSYASPDIQPDKLYLFAREIVNQVAVNSQHNHR